MTMLLPCASRKFAAQSRRLQQSPRPTIRRLTAKALPPTKTTAAAKPSSSPPATSATSPSPSPPTAAAAAAAPKPAPTAAAVIGAPELSLLFTAALWGSYAPALRFLFSLDQPPTPATLTAARAVVQAGLLLAFAAAGAGGAGGAGGASPPAAAAGTPKKEESDSPSSSSSSSSTTSSSLSPLAKFMKTPSPSLLTAGMELGAWNLAAAAFHAAGLSRTSATEAAFVVCATGLLTPLYAAAAGERQGARVWAGCGVALLGALALSLDKTGGGGGGMGSSAATTIPLSTSLAGDAFVLCAAAFYSAATFRLSVLAPVHASGPSGSSNSPQALAAAKSAAFAVGAVAWALSSGVLFSGADQGGLASLLPSAASASAAADGGGNPHSSSFAAPLVLAWAALGPGALAAVLQSRGQARVPAGRAQALFATVPLWSAALAGVALGERTGAAGWAGGLLIVAGGALAATAPREEE